MAMYDEYLHRHATQEVWSSPYEDNQYIFQMKRLSDGDGDINETFKFDRHISLPSTGMDYFVYMLGGNFPETFNLPAETEVWIPLIEWTNCGISYVRAYNEHGILIPYRNIFYYREYDGNLLFAILDDGTLPFRVQDHDIYFKFSTPYYLTQHDELPQTDKQFFLSEPVGSTGVTSNLLREQITRLAGKRHPIVLQNGMPQHMLHSAKLKDNVEIHDDGSVQHREYFKVSDLRFYQSDLDGRNKYLILPKGLDPYKVYYRDDIEIFLMKITDASLAKSKSQFPTYPKLEDLLDRSYIDLGAYYHANREESIRMVTHQSYGLPVDFVHAYIRHLDENFDLDQWYIRVSFRESGLNRKLIAERHRLIGLVQLPYKEQLNVMTDTDSQIAIWRASRLEKSAYNYIMRAYSDEITTNKIIEAYGYDQVAIALANPNVKITRSPTNDHFALPVALEHRATVYEYNREGTMLGWYVTTDTARYLASNRDTIFVEAYAGHGTRRPTEYFNPVMVEIKENVNWRFYKRDKDVEGIPIGKWEDVTMNPRYIKKSEDKFLIVPSSNHDIIAKSDESFLCKSVVLNALTDGVYDFTITLGEENRIAEIPPAQLAIWINGRALIENVDYRVNFPHVVIMSKARLNVTRENPNVVVTYRCIGFCRQDMTMLPPRDVGYITAGKLSVNDTYDLHHQRLNRIIIDGGIYDPDVIPFDEAYGEATVGDVLNGRPYSIETQYVSLQGLGGHSELYEAQIMDEENNEVITNYLSNKLNRTKPITEDFQKEMYRVYSPFMAAIIHEMEYKPERFRHFKYKDKAKIEAFVKPFRYLLKYDPAHLNYDEGRLWIQPEPYLFNDRETVEHTVLRFLERVNEIYLNGRIDVRRWFKTVRTREEEQ